MSKMSQAEFEKRAAAITDGLFEQVYKPAFVKFAAARGVAINTVEELDQAMSIAEMCEQYQQGQNTGILKQAAADLQNKLHPTNQPAANPLMDSMLKEAMANTAVRQTLTAGLQLQAAAAQGLVE
jgi:hypothetical protein